MANVFEPLFNDLWGEVEEDGIVYRTLLALGSGVTDLLVSRYLDFDESVTKRLIALDLFSRFPNQAIRLIEREANRAKEERAFTAIALALCAIGECSGDYEKSREHVLEIVRHYREDSAAQVLEIVRQSQGDPVRFDRARNEFAAYRTPEPGAKQPLDWIAAGLPPIAIDQMWIRRDHATD